MTAPRIPHTVEIEHWAIGGKESWSIVFAGRPIITRSSELECQRIARASGWIVSGVRDEETL